MKSATSKTLILCLALVILAFAVTLYFSIRHSEDFLLYLPLFFILSSLIILIARVKANLSKQVQKEFRFASLLDAAPDATLIVDDGGVIQMVNLQTKKLFNYSGDELIGRSVELLMPAELRKELLQHLAKFVSGPRVRPKGAGLELQATKKSGETFPVEISLSPLQTNEGILISASIRDISERKMSEKRFEALLNSAPDATVIVNDKGLIKMINKKTEELFGYRRIALIDKLVEILIPQELKEGETHQVSHVIKEPELRSMGARLELEATKSDGSKFPVEISLSPLQTEEGVLVSASIRDITNRKRLEQKFESLLDAAPDATVLVNEQGIIQMINHQTENLFGYTRKELVGLEVEILLPEELRHKHLSHRAGFIKAAGVRNMGEGIELNAVKKDGSRFPVEISLSPINTDEGLLVSASVRDITVRKNLENELKRTNAEVEAFTYSVSHDLRAPLRGIIGFATILKEDYSSKLDDEAKRLIAIIQNNTLKMGHLIDALLTFSRMGRKDIVKTIINTRTMVNEVIDELVSKKKNNMQWNIEDLPGVVGDINTIRQVWINLISNAIKYSGKKEHPLIKIGAFMKEGQTAFFIRDNGVGFDEKYKDKLFKVFQRLHSAEEFEGTGVGLALVERIIAKHGGKVWADAEVNKGANFYFSLPSTQ